MYIDDEMRILAVVDDPSLRTQAYAPKLTRSRCRAHPHRSPGCGLAHRGIVGSNAESPAPPTTVAPAALAQALRGQREQLFRRQRWHTTAQRAIDACVVGLAVLVEKPMCSDAADGTDLALCAHAALVGQLFLCTAHCTGFCSCWRAVDA
jgi:hypothetical protein